MKRTGLIESLIITVISSLILIAMGVIYFIITLWIVAFSSSLLGFSPDQNYVVLSAAIIVAGIMVGSAIKNT